MDAMDAIILRAEIAEKVKEAEVQIEAKVKEVEELEFKKEREIKKEEGIVKKLTLRAKISWDKVSSIVTGVITPLKEKGQLPEITIIIESFGKFDRTILNTKVKETLHQIGAKIEK